MVVRAVDGVDGRAVGRCRRELLGLEVGETEDGRFEAFGGCARRNGAGEVAGGRARERGQAQLLRLARRDRDDP